MPLNVEELAGAQVQRDFVEFDMGALAFMMPFLHYAFSDVNLMDSDTNVCLFRRRYFFSGEIAIDLFF